MSLRKLAEQQPCTIRLPGCSGGGDDSVLAHLRLPGFCGAGLKPPDWLAAIACSHCHDVVDGRKHIGYNFSEYRDAHFMGVARTWKHWEELGIDPFTGKKFDG